MHKLCKLATWHKLCKLATWHTTLYIVCQSHCAVSFYYSYDFYVSFHDINLETILCTCYFTYRFTTKMLNCNHPAALMATCMQCRSNSRQTCHCGEEVFGVCTCIRHRQNLNLSPMLCYRHFLNNGECSSVHSSFISFFYFFLDCQTLVPVVLLQRIPENRLPQRDQASVTVDGHRFVICVFCYHLQFICSLM